MLDTGEHGKHLNWLAEMDRIVRRVARERPEFTTNAVWDLHDKIGKYSTHNNSALGPLMQALAKEGVIRFTGRFIPSMRASQHKRHLKVWKSLIIK